MLETCGSLVGELSAQGALEGHLAGAGALSAGLSDRRLCLQSKTVIPADEPQTVLADEGYDGIFSVEVGAIPSNYGRIVWNGAVLTVS